MNEAEKERQRRVQHVRRIIVDLQWADEPGPRWTARMLSIALDELLRLVMDSKGREGED